jgi:hypothetical protein
VAEAGGKSSSDEQSPADAPPLTSIGNHHHIATTQSNPINIFAFLREHNGDPAVKVRVSERPYVLFSQWPSEFHTEIEGPRPL